MTDRSTIITAIADVLNRSSIYRVARGIVEVEKLFLIPHGLNAFVTQLKEASELPFRSFSPVEQSDTFYDMRVGKRWQLADTDHYVRIRVVSNTKNDFDSGEIKIAYPGPRSNPSVRYAPAEKLSQTEVDQWRRHLTLVGFSIEREYKKTRVSFVSAHNFDGYDVELEVDQFADDPCNGTLAGSSFVSFATETEGDKRQHAELILDEVARQFENMNFKLIACDGNYEDYFYGKRLPRHSAS